MTPPVYVLVGGKSSRFGEPKATHPVDGEPWALHVGRRLAADPADIVLVGDLEPSSTLDGVRRITDSELVDGPLGGLLAALADRGDGLLTLASCDLVRPEPAWIEPLLQQHTADPSLAVAAYATGDLWQPFPCVAHTRWLAPLLAAVREGARSFQQAFASATAAKVSMPVGEFPHANTAERLNAILDSHRR